MTPATLSIMHERIAELIESDSVREVEQFMSELSGYGIETEDQVDDAYYGCYPSVEAFCEDVVNDCYLDVIDALPVWIQSAIDYELAWHQSMRHDFFEVYFNGDYYFFNRNF